MTLESALTFDQILAKINAIDPKALPDNTRVTRQELKARIFDLSYLLEEIRFTISAWKGEISTLKSFEDTSGNIVKLNVLVEIFGQV